MQEVGVRLLLDELGWGWLRQSYELRGVESSRAVGEAKKPKTPAGLVLKLRMEALPRRLREIGDAMRVNSVRIALDAQLPLGVWVEGSTGRFFQKLEYEKISSFCFKCGKIGHLIKDCSVVSKPNAHLGVADSSSIDVTAEKSEEVIAEKVTEYGPWIHVNYGKRKKVSGIGKVAQRRGCSGRVASATVRKNLGTLGLGSNAENSVEMNGVLAESLREEHRAYKSDVVVVNAVSCTHEIAGIQKEELSIQKTVKDPVELLSPPEDCKLDGKVNIDLDFPSVLDREEGEVSLEGAGLVASPEVGSNLDAPKFKLWKELKSLGSVRLRTHSRKEASSQVVVGELNIVNDGVWLVATVYESNDCYKRRSLWRCLEMYLGNNIPTIISGDFNCILSQEDKRSGKKFSLSQGAQDMLAFMRNYDFHDVGVVGPRYTWCNNKSGRARVLERLDRCILNSVALGRVKLAVVRHLTRVASDHCPVMLKVFSDELRRHRVVRFEDVWLTYPASFSIVYNSWKKPMEGDAVEILNRKFKRSLRALFFWSKAKHRNLQKLKDELKNEILELREEEANIGGLSEQRLLLLRSKVNELNSTLARRNGNCISYVKDSYGNLVEEKGRLEGVFFYFFKEKWRDRGCNLGGWPYPDPKFDLADRLFLEKEFSRKELEDVIVQLKNNKSLGKDGITFSFIRSYWFFIKEDVLLAISSFFNSEASRKSTRVVKNILTDYCSWTGQKINVMKSSILFGKSVKRKRQRSLSRLMGIKVVTEMEYLGVKIALRRLRRKRGRGLHSMVDKCGPLRAKFAWSFINKPDSLLNRSLLAKYDNQVWESVYRRNASATWKILLNGAKFLQPLIRWKVSSGASIDTVKDVWILDKSICRWPTFVAELDESSNVLLGRNKVTHGGRDDSSMYIAVNSFSHAVASFRSSYISENWDANQLCKLSQNSWRPPPPGWVKANVDATLTSSNKADIGGVFRDSKGRFLYAFGSGCLHWDGAQVEVLSVLALKNFIEGWMHEAKGIIVEGDNYNVINFFQGLLNKEGLLNLKDLEFLDGFKQILFRMTLVVIMFLLHLSAERLDPREVLCSRIPNMITSRGCHSMTVLNEKLFVMGGYDGDKMVSTVEIYDPRANAWMPGEPMKCNRGYGASALLGNSVFIIGGIENGENMIETIECYEEGAGWKNSRLKAVGKRCFFSAIVL
ncbi:hypothetical protein M5K25_017943 [Dendrobium thyrsiflorum]|uniref:CCHC-type domain-containing protein n=1 Tax=Dendrobium thyrsiflorum TaxID=117978 RepID=A0ABD0UGT4_DENTH